MHSGSGGPETQGVHMSIDVGSAYGIYGIYPLPDTG